MAASRTEDVFFQPHYDCSRSHLSIFWDLSLNYNLRACFHSVHIHDTDYTTQNDFRSAHMPNIELHPPQPTHHNATPFQPVCIVLSSFEKLSNTCRCTKSVPRGHPQQLTLDRQTCSTLRRTLGFKDRCNHSRSRGRHYWTPRHSNLLTSSAQWNRHWAFYTIHVTHRSYDPPNAFFFSYIVQRAGILSWTSQCIRAQNISFFDDNANQLFQ